MRAAGIALALALVGPGAWAQGAGEVTHVSGTLMASRPGAQARLLGPRSTVEQGEVLSTAAETYARVKFTDGGEVTLRPNTELRIEAYQYDPKNPQRDNFVISLVKGGLRSLTGLLGKRRPNSYELRTPVATIGVRGTHYGALFCQADCGALANNAKQVPGNGLHVDVAEGQIVVSNRGGQLLFGQGSFGFVPNGQTVPQIVPPQQGITVAVPPPAARLGALPPTASGPGVSPQVEDCVAQ